MGSILALFRPSGPLCFPVRQGAFSVSGGRAAAATGATGGFYVSLYKQWYKNWSKTITTCPKLLFFSGFRRDVRQFLRSILALFRPSGPLCFPVRQGAFSVSGGRAAAAATGAAGGFYILLYKQWYNNWSKTINKNKTLSKTIVFLGFQKGR